MFSKSIHLDNPNNTHEFLNPREALSSPLASKLFRIDGIQSVFFGHDFITVTKKPEANWQIMKPDIYGSIMDFVSTGEQIIQKRDVTIEEDDDEVVQMIKELLDTRILPTIQEDGGDISSIYRAPNDTSFLRRDSLLKSVKS